MLVNQKYFNDVLAMTGNEAYAAILAEAIEKVASNNYNGVNNVLIMEALLYLNGKDIKEAKNYKTYAAWKAEGKQVNKGEKSSLKASLWIRKQNVKEVQKKDGSTEEKTQTNFYLKSSSLFHISQVS